MKPVKDQGLQPVHVNRYYSCQGTNEHNAIYLCDETKTSNISDPAANLTTAVALKFMRPRNATIRHTGMTGRKQTLLRALVGQNCDLPCDDSSCLSNAAYGNGVVHDARLISSCTGSNHNNKHHKQVPH